MHPGSGQDVKRYLRCPVYMHICILECMGRGLRCHSVPIMLLCHTYRPDWRERNTKQNRGVPCLLGLGRAGEYHACQDWAELGSTVPVGTVRAQLCSRCEGRGGVSAERVTWNRPL